MSPEWKEYLSLFFKKILENLASVKTWFFILPFIISSLYLGWIISQHFAFVKLTIITLAPDNKDLLVMVLKEMSTVTTTFISWCTFNVSLAGTIIVVRETFKVNKLKEINVAASNGAAGTDAKEKIAQMSV